MWMKRISFCSLLMVIAAIGCDFNPSAPSAGSIDAASQGTVSDHGATLNGRFLGDGGSASALGAFASTALTSDLTVIVLDSNLESSEIGRVEVVNGRFTLRGLPESFILEFWDGENRVGVETFEGVKPNQEIDIVLDIDEKTGEVVIVEQRRTGIDHQPGEGIEIDGAARNIVEDDPHPDWTGSLDVNQVHVRGVFLEVDGKTQVFAHEIKLQEEEEDELAGSQVTICHIPPGNPDNKKTMTVPAGDVAGHLGHGDTLGPC